MSKKGIIVSLFALVVSVATLIASFFETETLSITSSFIAMVLFAIAFYQSAVKGKGLNSLVLLLVAAVLVVAALPTFFDIPENITIFMDTCPYVAVAALIVVEMIAYMGVRLDKLLFSFFTLFFEMAIASFAAVVTYLIRIEDIRNEIVVNNDIVVQFGAGFIIAVVVVVAVFYIFKSKGVRLITDELLLEE